MTTAAASRTRANAASPVAAPRAIEDLDALALAILKRADADRKARRITALDLRILRTAIGMARHGDDTRDRWLATGEIVIWMSVPRIANAVVADPRSVRRSINATLIPAGYFVLDRRGGGAGAGNRNAGANRLVLKNPDSVSGVRVKNPDSVSGFAKRKPGLPVRKNPDSESAESRKEINTSPPTARAAIPPAAVLLGRVGPPKVGGGGSRKRARPTAADGQRELLPPVVIGGPPTRIPENWEPDEDDRRFATDHGLTADQVYREGVKFVAWWRARRGSAGASRDWKQEWRLWVMRAVEDEERRRRRIEESGHGNGRAGGPAGRGTVEKGMRDGFAALRARAVGEDR